MPDAGDKALIFEKPDHQGPGTHVLLIGIGNYPSLLGGSKANEAIAEGMEQVASPPRSARALADWLIDGNFRNPEKPLASVSLLLSEKTTSNYRGKKVPRGTIADVERAIAAWIERASTDPENQVIFFFAGHGVSAPSIQLLVRDYGENPHNRFGGALNFNNFRGAMANKVPGYQLFLIDACRSPDSLARAVRESGEVGRNVVTPETYRAGGAANQSVHHGAAPLGTAYGATEGLGIYTQAIIRALSGGGAQPDIRWWVGTSGLDTALSAYTVRLASKLGLKQMPERLAGVNFKIHEPAKPLQVPVYVSCAPETVWRERIHFEARVGGQVSTEHVHDPAADPDAEEWSLTVPYREHLLSAKFEPAAPFEDLVDEVLSVGLPETAIELAIRDKQP
jgi:hypothetical protein